MKKRFFILSCILMLSVFTVTGCDNDEKVSTEEETVEIQNEEDNKTEDVNKNETGSEANSKENAEELRIVTLYYVDDQTAEITKKDVEIKDENDLWKELQKAGILTDDCSLLSIQTDETSGVMELDFNSATGERIRSMGTTGETEIIGCIVNTYLEAYNCEKIKLKEEGDSFESSHASYDGYITYMEF